MSDIYELRLTPTTIMALLAAAEREGVTIDAIIDRYLSLAIVVDRHRQPGYRLMLAPETTFGAVVFTGLGADFLPVSDA
jgi:hypothetical protein